MRSCIAIVFLCTVLTGCVSWRRQPLGVSELLASEKKEMAIRLATRSGGQLVLQEPRIVGETVVGIIRRPPVRQNLEETFVYQIEDSVTVPLAEVVAVDIHRVSVVRSAAVAAALLYLPYEWIRAKRGARSAY